MRWLLMVIFTTAVAVAAGQNPSLPEGDGKSIATGACAGCHGVDQIVAKTGTRDDWAAIVDRMKSYGMNLDAKQTTTVVDYLAKSFPPKGATAPQTPPAAGQDDAADAAGKALVNGICSSCHGADLTTAKEATRTDWQSVIERMKGYGAVLDETQTAILLDYLVKNHGPKQTPAAATTAPAATTTPAATTATANPGKAALDSFCTNCHDLDLVTGRTGTQGEWQEIVDRMNGRGAGVPEKDIPVLVQYLVKTYPPK
jgi:cytochrome c5